MREATLLTPLSVSQKTTYLEWGTQPSLFKHYPAWCYRISYKDHSDLLWLSHVRAITDSRMLGDKPYNRLNVPSAGNLHPIEIYIQVRNVAGVLDGIYHLDPTDEKLVLIQEIGKDGIEPHVGLSKRVSGFVVLLSLVPYRSVWKYGLRAWRYLYLDLGHQIAALRHSTDHFGLSITNLSNCHNTDITRIMGMGEDEFIAAAYVIGELSARDANMIAEPLIHVQPCDYSRRDSILTKSLQEEPIFSNLPVVCEWDATAMQKRRSARAFYPDTIQDQDIQKLMSLPSSKRLVVYHIVLQAHTMQPGVYHQGVCIEAGNLADTMYDLLLEQRFVKDANMVSLIYAEHFDAQSHTEAGVYGQNLYITATRLNIGCSGIGAFYDERASRWCDLPLLYAVATGGME